MDRKFKYALDRKERVLVYERGFSQRVLGGFGALFFLSHLDNFQLQTHWISSRRPVTLAVLEYPDSVVEVARLMASYY